MNVFIWRRHADVFDDRTPRSAAKKQKKFLFPAGRLGSALEQGLSDAAQLNGCSATDVVVDTLADALLPADPMAAQYVTRVLSGSEIQDGERRRYGVREALADIFADEAAGIDCQARHDNDLPLAEFARDILRDSRAHLDAKFFSKSNDPTFALVGHFGSVCDAIEAEARKREGDVDWADSARYSREIGRIISVDRHFPLSSAVSLIITCWPATGNLSVTFRFLSAVFSACSELVEGPSTRSRFATTCQAVMSAWTAADMAESDRRRKAIADASMTSYDLADGDYVTVPRGWIAANPEEAIASHYVGIVEVKNGAKYDAPHIVFFSKSPVSGQFDEARRAEALAAATSAWPPLEQIMRDEVQLQYRDDGGIANMSEFAAAPHIAIFAIADKNDYLFGRPPFGACITRAGAEAENSKA